MGSSLRELAVIARSLRQQPLFTAAVVLTLGLGIGAATAIFSVVNAVLLRPLPYADDHELVAVWEDLRTRGVIYPLATATFADMEEAATLFEEFAAATGAVQITVAGDDGREPDRVAVASATHNLFALLGVPMAAGRDFTSADAVSPPREPGVPPPPPPAVISYEFWQRRFGGDPAIVGSIVDAGPRIGVIGVLPEGFQLLLPAARGVEPRPDVWTPFRREFASDSPGARINNSLIAIGRMSAGVVVDQAQQQLEAIAADIRNRVDILDTAGLYLQADSMRDGLVAEVRPTLVILMGAAILVLLVASANVANLMLVRSATRERDLAVRSALGASRWSLVRQLLIESSILGGAGALLGLGLARLGVGLLLRLAPADLPRIAEVRLDMAVLAAAMASTLLAVAIFGLVPAARVSRPNVLEVLRKSGRADALRGGRFMRGAVVVSQVALCFVLLVGSGLMVRSFIAIQRADLGFDPGNVMTFLIPSVRASGTDGRVGAVREIRQRLLAIPGVTGVTAADPLPLDGGGRLYRYGPEESIADSRLFRQGTYSVVQPNYFDLMGTQLLEGRTFTEADDENAPMVVVIDETMASRMFPGESAVGQRIMARWRGAEMVPFEIIGVVEHQRFISASANGPEQFFMTDAFMGGGRANRWAVRTTGEPANLVPQIRAAIAGVDPTIALFEMEPYSLYVGRARAQARFALVLILIFAGVTVALTAVGLYGVISTAARQRTAEIGLRVAVGASGNDIVRLIVGYGLRLSAAGIVLGLVAALVLTRLLASQLVDVTPTDPATFAAAVAAFLGLAMIACGVPAIRAARLDPVSALRNE